MASQIGRAASNMMLADPVGSMARGNVLAGQVADVRHQQDYRNMLSQNGAGIMRGDPNALAAMAGFDPAGATSIQQTRQTMQQSAELQPLRIREARDSIARAAAQEAARMSAEERQQDLAALEEARFYAEQGDMTRAFQAARGALEGLDQAGINLASEDGAAQLGLLIEGTRRGLIVAQGGQVQEAKGPETEAEREIARLVAQGIPERDAILIKEGIIRLESDPATGDARLVNMHTGEVRELGGPAEQPAQPAGPTFSPQAMSGQGGNAFGLPGVAARIANPVTEFVTGQQIAPRTGEEQAYFEAVKEQLVSGLAMAYPRMPAETRLRRLDTLVPAPGTGQGTQSAQQQIAAQRDLTRRDLETLQRSLQRRIRPAERQEIEARVLGMQQLLATLDEVDARLRDTGGGQAAAPADIPASFLEMAGPDAAELWQAMPPEDRALFE